MSDQHEEKADEIASRHCAGSHAAHGVYADVLAALRQADAAAFARGVGEERERCCKAVCWRCQNGVPAVFIEPYWYHSTLNGDVHCLADAIRRRAAKETP